MQTHLALTNETIKQAIDKLVTFDLIPAIDKAHILLVANGDKPSMHTGFFSEPMITTQQLSDIDREKREYFASIVTDLGLYYRTETTLFKFETDNTSFYRTRVVLCMAPDMKVADALFHAREQGDEKTEGLLLGFPESAVEAFVSDDLLDMDHHPASTNEVEADAMKLLNHRLSKDNWEREVIYLTRHARAIKQLSPTIYDQCMSE